MNTSGLLQSKFFLGLHVNFARDPKYSIIARASELGRCQCFENVNVVKYG